MDGGSRYNQAYNLPSKTAYNSIVGYLSRSRHISSEGCLGHGSITSTEVYAKVALEKKIEAVNLFNGVFD